MRFSFNTRLFLLGAPKRTDSLVSTQPITIRYLTRMVMHTRGVFVRVTAPVDLVDTWLPLDMRTKRSKLVLCVYPT